MRREFAGASQMGPQQPSAVVGDGDYDMQEMQEMVPEMQEQRSRLLGDIHRICSGLRDAGVTVRNETVRRTRDPTPTTIICSSTARMRTASAKMSTSTPSETSSPSALRSTTCSRTSTRNACDSSSCSRSSDSASGCQEQQRQQLLWGGNGSGNNSLGLSNVGGNAYSQRVPSPAMPGIAVTHAQYQPAWMSRLSGSGTLQSNVGSSMGNPIMVEEEDGEHGYLEEMSGGNSSFRPAPLASAPSPIAAAAFPTNVATSMVPPVLATTPQQQGRQEQQRQQLLWGGNTSGNNSLSLSNVGGNAYS